MEILVLIDMKMNSNDHELNFILRVRQLDILSSK